MLNQLISLGILQCVVSFPVELMSKHDEGVIAEPSLSISNQDEKSTERSQMDLLTMSSYLDIGFGTSVNETYESCYSVLNGKCIKAPHFHTWYRYDNIRSVTQCQSVCSFTSECKGFIYDDLHDRCYPIKKIILISCSNPTKIHQIKTNCYLHDCYGDTVHATICGSVSPPMCKHPGNSVSGSYIGSWSHEEGLLGRASFTIMCSIPTNIEIQIEAMARSPETDSFELAWDDLNSRTFFLNGREHYSKWTWYLFHQKLPLSNGDHNFEVIQKEQGARLRTVRIVQSHNKPCTFMPNDKTACTSNGEDP